MLGSIGASLYWGLAYRGPYRWLAEWQLRLLGEYWPMLTGLCTLLITFPLGVLPAAIAIQIAGARSQQEPSPDGLAANQASGDAITHWVMERPYRLFAAGISIVFMLVGGFFALRGATAGERALVDVAVLEQGQTPENYHVELQGRLLIDEAARVTKPGGPVEVYAPIVSNAWRPGQPVPAYLEISEASLEQYARDLATGRYQGMLSDLPLPGVAQTALTERGLPPAERYWVLDYRQKPDDTLALGLALLSVGAPFGVVTAFIWIDIERRRARRSPNG